MESGSEGDDNSSVIGGRSLSGDEDDSDEESSESGEEEEYILDLSCNILQKIKENNPDTTELIGNGSYERIQIMTDEEWEELGRDISNNTHLTNVFLYDGALNDHKMSFFRGLTRSSTIQT